jgi:GWxTD domain-containing protein
MLPLLITTLAVLIVGGSPPGTDSAKRVAAQKLFHETASARDSLPLDTYIAQLEQVIQLDKKFAEAFHELGRAWIEKGTIDGRNRAQLVLERAIQLAPRNTDYHYTLAQLHLRRNMHGAAASEFRKIMKIDPADPRPYYHLALFKEEDMFHYRDLISPHEDATIYFYEFAEEDFVEAERLLRTAIVLDPKMAEAYYRLAALYYEARRYEEMADLLEQAIAQKSSADFFLFLGLARQRLEDNDGAMAAYERALQLMSPTDREFFYSLQTVLSPDSLKVYEHSADSLKTQMERQFWKSRDPLFLTSANERLLEHFGRIAYANLRYSFPEKKIEGWKTDRGKTLIRFGEPRWRVRTRADLGTTPAGHVTLNASKEFWDYGDFRMIFDDRFLNRNYSFAWGGIDQTDGKWLFENKIHEESERYTFPHGGQRLHLPHVIAQFRDSDDKSISGKDSTLLEIYFGISDSALNEVEYPDFPLGVQKESRGYELRRGLFFFDEKWNAVAQWQEDRQLLQTPVSRLAQSKNVPRLSGVVLSNHYLIDRWPVRLPPGAYNFSLEVLDRESGHSGAERERIIVEDFSDGRLHISSIILANLPKDESSALTIYSKDGINLVPNLFRRFSPQTPIYVYYEVYNLQLDAGGQSRYRIDNIVEPLIKGKGILASALGRFSRILGLGERPVSITSSFESIGTSSTEKIYHSLEIQGQQTAQYNLTIRFTDLITGQSTSQQVTFEMANLP